MMGVQLFVGGQPATVAGEVPALSGYRMFSAANRRLPAIPLDSPPCYALDSGAFSDSPAERLTPEGALDRQLAWERWAAARWGIEHPASYLVSYDLLIDETWTAGTRHKRRWGVGEAARAVEETIAAAHYLASQREPLAPRRLILCCQGVDAMQYSECVTEVLRVATPEDWVGLGGWCILGRWTSWLPTFWQTLRLTLPRIADAGVQHVHIFGVLYLPALGSLLWLADQHGLSVSTDSSRPLRDAACTSERARQRAGLRRRHWRDNVAWWRDALATLRASEHYREPPDPPIARQLSFSLSQTQGGFQ